MINRVIHACLGPIWYHSEPSEIPYSPNQFLGWDFFCRFLQQDGFSPHAWSWVIQPKKARSRPVFSSALIYRFHFSGCAKCLLCFKWWKLNFGRNAKWLLENCGHWNYADNWWKSWFEWFHQWHTGRTINDVFFFLRNCSICPLFSWYWLSTVGPR